MRPYRLRAAAPRRWHWRPARRAASAGARSPAPPAARYRAVTQRFPEALQWSALTAAARVEASSGAQADESLGKELGRDALAASHQRGGHAYLHALDLTGLAGVTRTGGKRQGGGEGEPSGRVRQRYPDQGHHSSSLLRCYQPPDEATMLTVVLGAAELRGKRRDSWSFLHTC
jgi:hypothetical protein